jgi:hypothetical protein
MLIPYGAPGGGPAAERVSRALLLLLLASRTAAMAYAVCVETINLDGYQRPGLAVAAVVLALLASAGAGILAWHRQAVCAAGAVADTLAATLVLLALSLAIRPTERMGSLNWALAYSVSCASWLALGKVRWWRALLACLLGVMYGLSVLRYGSGAATTVTVAVNALSPPLYFGIAATAFRVMYHIADEIDTGQETERRELGEAARLRERERLFQEMHQPVLAVLEAIASAGAPEGELRARAYAEAAVLRHAFANPGQEPAPRLQTQLALLVREQVGNGWTIRLVDDEVMAEPSAAITHALCDAIAGLLGEIAATPVPGKIRIRVQCDDSGAGVVIRITGCEELAESAVRRARACLALVSGTVSLAPALSGEQRVLLWAPP